MQQDENTLDVQEEIQENDTQDTTEVVEAPEKDWKAEAMKLQRLLTKKNKPQNLSTQEKSPEINTDSLLDNLTLVKDFTPEEINEARTAAKELGTDMFKFIQSKAGKNHLDTFRKEKRDTDSTLAPSNRGVVFKGKQATELFRDANASPEDKQAAFEALRQGKKGSAL